MGFWLRHLFHPERYHGRGRKPPFFEGWYYKLVDSTEEHRLAVIPGIFLSGDPAEHHAFVQVLDGSTTSSAYHRFAPGEFEAARNHFEIRVGENLFTSERMILDLDDTSGRVSGEVRFEGTVPWPVTLRSPGIMGWYAWAPFMECYHGVLSLDHELSGELAKDGQALDFTGGRGYIEKDWGKSFPAAWIWVQTNHFAEQGTSLSASIAIIPWLSGAFPGFIVGLWHEGRLFRFATYTGARTERLEIGDDAIAWTVVDRRCRLEMYARRARGGLLHGPGRDRMHQRVSESLSGEVEVRLTTLSGGEVFAGTGRHAGVEVQGELDRLLDLQRTQR